MFRKTISDFVAREIKANAERWEEIGEVSREVFRTLCDVGIIGARYDDKCGGSSLDFKNAEWLSDFTLCQSYADLELIARTMMEAGTKPEIEIYDPGMINNALLLQKIGAIAEPMHFSFVMGIPGQINAPTPRHLSERDSAAGLYLAGHRNRAVPISHNHHDNGAGRPCPAGAGGQSLYYQGSHGGK
jgi:hypothetical protein